MKKDIPEVGDQRISPQFEVIFEEAIGTKYVREALMLMCGLVGTAFRQEAKGVRFDRRTGRPSSVVFKTFEVWDGKVYISAPHCSPNLGKGDPLHNALRKTIKKGEILVFGRFAICHEEDSPENKSHGSPDFYRIVRVKRL